MNRINGKNHIAVTGIQRVDGEENVIEMEAWGEYMCSPRLCRIIYSEVNMDNPEEFGNVTIDIRLKEREVRISRRGGINHTLNLKQDSRYSSVYETSYGNLTLGVYTNTIDFDFNENGGYLKIKYTIDYALEIMSENIIIIKVNDQGGN